MSHQEMLLPLGDTDLPKLKEPNARYSDPVTSHEAAFDARRFSKGNRLLVLQLLLKHGGMIDHELASRTGLQHNSIGKRRGECYQAGLVDKKTEFGDVCKRLAPSGSKAIVWEITDSGVKFLNNHGV